MNARSKLASIVVASIVLGAVTFTVAWSQRVAAQQIFGPTNTCTNSNPCLEEDNLGTGVGVKGLAINASGVFGDTKFKSTSPPGKSGVFGLDDTGKGIFNSGVFGKSTAGTGVLGESVTGFGISGYGIPGVVGTLSGFDAAGLTAYDAGVAGIGGGGNGVYAVTSARPRKGFASLYVSGADTDSGCCGAPLIIGNNYHSGDVMSLDVDGMMILRGSLTQLGTPLVGHRISKGSIVGTYTAQTTQPVTEDFGEAQLVGGYKYVRLDPEFIAVTQRGARYLVFLTPQGETTGLYVTQKTSVGFMVREIGDGRSNVAFDFRIVAEDVGRDHPRLPNIPDTLNHGQTVFPAATSIKRR